MRHQTIAEMIRPAAKRWAETATLEELAAVLPAKLFFKIQVGQSAEHTSSTGDSHSGPPVGRRRRRKRLSRKAKQAITERLAGTKYGTPAYREARDQLATELGVTARQVSSFVRQAKPTGGRRRKAAVSSTGK